MNNKYIITELNNKYISAIYNDDNKYCRYLKILDSGSIVGNVYIGRVENIVKNINCAFIEIEDKQKCYFDLKDNPNPIILNKKNNSNINIGDKILVQVVKEPVKTKPATVSSKIEFSGKYIVLSNDVNGVSISKKIKNNFDSNLKKDIENELNSIIANAIEEIGYADIIKFGLILRSSCANASYEDIICELKDISKQYIEMLRGAIYGVFYTLLHKEIPEYFNDIVHLTADNEYEIITDLKDVYDYLNNSLNNKNCNIRFYEDNCLPLYKLYSIEKEISEGLKKNVWLDCGGYLVIEQTEAMTVIDVNTGKNVPKSKNQTDKEKTLLKTNLEAADKLFQQLMIRNISGIIIVDFINMEDENNIDILMNRLKTLAKKDMCSCSIIDITKLGLVEITRKRTGKSLSEIFIN